MFTWICPQCGREVPPAYTECPDCAAKAHPGGAAPAAETVAAPPQYPPPPPQAAMPQPQSAPPAPPAPVFSAPATPSQPAPPPPAQPSYQTGQFYLPQQGYPAQQYQAPYPPQPYPPQNYPPQQPVQYPAQQYPPQPYQGAPYPPPQYPPQYGPPQYTAPYPAQPYAPPAPPRPEPPPEPAVVPEPVRMGGTLFGSAPAAPAEPAAYAPPPPAARVETATAVAPAPVEPSHEPGAPRAGGTLFAAAVPAEQAARKGLPTWLMTVLFAAGFVILVFGIYSLVNKSHGQAPSTTVESPAAQPGAPTNVWQKYIEVSGVRFVESAKKEPMVRFVLTNHSGEDAEDLAGNVTLWGRTRKSEEDAAGTFTFKTTVPANGIKEMEEPLTTKLKIYELPDWQFVSADLQITGPGGSAQTTPAK